MEHLKTEIHVKLVTIADMSSHARSLIAPYRRFGSNIRIENINRPEERVLLVVEEEQYIVVLDWNFLIFVHQGERTGFDQSDGRLRFFLDIYSDLQDLKGFSGIEQVDVKSFSLAPGHCPDAAQFRERYLPDTLPAFTRSLQDAAVILEGGLSGSRTYNVQYGPYAQAKDAQLHNLDIFSGRNAAHRRRLEEAKGLLIRTDIVSKGEEVSFALIRSMLKQSDELVEQIT